MNDNFRLLVARLERATVVREEMWRVAAEHIQAHPIQRRVEHDGHRYAMYLHAPQPFPSDLSVLFGEWLYLLRSALDGLMYEIVVHDTQLDPPKNASRIYYPTFDTAESFTSKFKMQGLSDGTRKRIEATQPYHSTGGHTGSALWWINELARLDRHRRGHSLVWRIVEIHIELPSGVFDAEGVRICDQLKAFIRHDEELEVAVIVTKPGAIPNPNDGIDMSWNLQFDVPEWINKVPRSYGVWGIEERMENAEIVVHETIKMFDAFFRQG